MAKADGTPCYLCDRPITEDHAVVTVRRVGLTLHLSCYERDVFASGTNIVARALRSIRQSRRTRRRA